MRGLVSQPKRRSNVKKWYLCKHDILVTMLVTIVAFLIGRHHNILIPNSMDKMINQLDWWVLILLFEWGFFTAAVLVIAESLFIHLEHYWPWIVIAVFSTTGARFIGQELGSPNAYSGFMIDLVLNSLIYGLFITPVAASVFVLRRKSGRNKINGI